MLIRIFKKPLLILCCLLSAAGCGKQAPGDYSTSLFIGGKEIRVEIADTDQSRARGLSGRQPLSDERGMLFDFKNTGQSRPAFWMKDMLFDLDLIWIRNNSIVEITPDVPAPRDCPASEAGCHLPTYSPSVDVDMVLEVTAGWTKRHNVREGDPVAIKN